MADQPFQLAGNPATEFLAKDLGGQYALATWQGAVDASPDDVDAPAVNTAAVVTYAAAGAGVSHVISGIAWSYDAAPTGGNLQIEDGAGNVVLSVDIAASGHGVIEFRPPKRGTANTALVITLAAGGANVTGKLSVLGHWTE